MIIALALLDDLPVMTIVYDDVPAPPKPVSWDMPRVLTIASVLGFLTVGQSFGLMYIGDTIWHIDRAHLQTIMFLRLVAGGHMIVSREDTRRVSEAAISGPSFAGPSSVRRFLRCSRVAPPRVCRLCPGA
jgi:H+-transporting ATPase